MMSWSIGYDNNWNRDIGYSVPAVCDHPGCSAEIHRGLSYVCGGEPYGGEHGCGLYFCAAHLWITARRPQRCERCSKHRKPFLAKPDCQEWIEWKLTDESWQRWREENPETVIEMRTAIGMAPAQEVGTAEQTSTGGEAQCAR
ncbi:hypothetical protein ACKI2N_001805 [Cupriavidus sp. 30B13]|uniref:hypothetical protein n=1 Tax=Cupriavidus sp. 30B13 TaxID=3384241 RepID=UPI003B90C9A0